MTIRKAREATLRQQIAVRHGCAKQHGWAGRKSKRKQRTQHKIYEQVSRYAATKKKMRMTGANETGYNMSGPNNEVAN